MRSTTPAEPAILILGASVRAAAFSARRAGWKPFAADLFGDRDLTVCCPERRVVAGAYPAGLAEASAAFPSAPWMYTGALENHSALIADISRHRRLWGNNADIIGRVRDPRLVSRCLANTGLPHPRVRAAAHMLPVDGSWLAKPVASAGGIGIEPYHGSHDFRGQQRQQQVYYQQHVEGVACSAVYVGNGEHACLLGVTRQLVGEPMLGARPFAYCGSVGPLELSDEQDETFNRLGHVLAAEFGLLGLFGVDCVLHENVPWVIEVNPRYTASVEVLEYATGMQAMSIHRRACVEKDLPTKPMSHVGVGSKVGKAILFALSDATAPDMAKLMCAGDYHRLPEAADIPPPGQIISRGRPILTVFASADDLESCYEQLIKRARRIHKQCTPPARLMTTGAGRES